MIGGEPGVEVHLLPVGASVQRVVVRCGDGARRDVALGLPDGEAVRQSRWYVGSVVGRYANRIAHGRFDLDGITHTLETNDRGHHLHGGTDGFHSQTWTVVEHAPTAVTFELVSPDGDGGYPGEVTARASYRVEGDELCLELTATTTAPTVVNLTSHVYLDLDGTRSVEEHVLQVPASAYLPVDGAGIPFGDPAAVDGSRFDLREPVRVGDVGGLDHDFVVDGTGWRRVAALDGLRTQTRVELWSDQPGLQVFTADALDGSEPDRTGRPLSRRAGIALEPQLHPDTPNHPGRPGRPVWPSAVLRPGETYRHRTAWRFHHIGSIQ